jgi:hypothetical protein
MLCAVTQLPKAFPRAAQVSSLLGFFVAPRLSNDFCSAELGRFELINSSVTAKVANNNIETQSIEGVKFSSSIDAPAFDQLSAYGTISFSSTNRRQRL